MDLDNTNEHLKKTVLEISAGEGILILEARLVNVSLKADSTLFYLTSYKKRFYYLSDNMQLSGSLAGMTDNAKFFTSRKHDSFFPRKSN